MLRFARVTTCRPLVAVLLVGGTLASLIGGLRAPEASAATPQLVVPCSGPGGGEAGLVSAIYQASNGGTIVLSPGCTYVLTQAHGGFYAGCSCTTVGLPDLVSDITIEGNGATIERDPSAPPFGLIRVVNIPTTLPSGLSENVAVDLTGLTLRGGLQTNVEGTAIPVYLSGGAIDNDGALLKLDGVTVTGNTAIGSGGGIDNIGGGTLSASESVVTANTSMGATDSPPSPTGGGIYNQPGSTASVAGSVVINNQPNNCSGVVVGCVG